MLWVGAVAAATACGMAWAARGRSATLFAPSVWRGAADRPQIALTFDDGPSESTPELLEILDKYSAKATFFVCGRNVQRLPAILKEVVDAGHEIGNHTWSHRRFDFMSRRAMRDEIGAAQDIVSRTTGVEPRYFRAPYGVRWPGLGSVQREFGLMGMMWSVIGRDWRLDGLAVARRVVARAPAGAIICLHDGRELAVEPDIRATLTAVREIVPRLQDRNLAFVTASAMLER